MRYFAILLTMIFFWGCYPGEDALRTELCFTTQHHELIIPNINIYVKFNTTTFPGYDPDASFDRTLVSDANGRVCMKDFPLGEHWFVGIGYDEIIREQVIGQMRLRFDLTQLKVDTILYVGEE